MRVHNVEQNSPEWYQLRLGLPTASDFHRIITPTGKRSTQADEFSSELVAEMLLARDVKAFVGNYHTERGHELEPQAVQLYEFVNEVKTTPGGFVTDDAVTMGCSPDRLIGDEGLLEVKCCKPAVMVDYILTQAIDRDFKPQLQGQLLVTGRAYVDLVPFHPDFPAVSIRVERDEEYLKLMQEYMEAFLDDLKSKRARMVGLGYMEA